MKILLDFTGPVASDTGGNTYPTYVLPTWWKTYTDELVPVFSHGQVPASLENRESLIELSPLPSGTPYAMTRLIDKNVRFNQQVVARAADIAFYPANFASYGLPRRIPVVVAVRSMLYYHYPTQVSLAFRTYKRLATAHAVRRAGRIIVPSSATADDLMRRVGAQRKTIVVVPHGIDLELFRPGGADAVIPNRFLFVSKPWDYKGLATVIRAVALIQRRTPSADIQLAVADGGMSADELIWLTDLVRDLHLEDRVSFLGRVDHDRLVQEYQQASALVVPSSIESFGNPSMEAAACGCPIITSFGHGIDETIGPVASQVPAHDHAVIAETMLAHMRMDTTERVERSAVLRAWAERFPWSRTVTETREVLTEVAG